MEIERSTAVKLLQDVGLIHADKYTLRELTMRVRRLPNVVDEYTEVRTPESDQVFERLLTALAQQEPINITGREPVVVEELPDGTPVEPETSDNDDDDDDETPKPKRSGKKQPAAKANKQPAPKTATKKSAGKKPKGERGPGVIGTIIEVLQSASQKKPITLEKVVDELAKRFPDREKKSMLSTVKVQISGRIQRERGLKVKHNDKNGYWIEDKK